MHTIYSSMKSNIMGRHETASASVLHPAEVPLQKSFTASDIIVYVLLLGLGVFQFVFTLRSDDVVWGYSSVDQAKSIIERGFYGLGSMPQTMRPPGFPLMLASLCITVGCTNAVLLRSLIVLTTVGFIASYELIRDLESRLVAAVSCLLLATSPIIFSISTRMVWSDLPYFFTSVMTLLLAVRMDAMKSSRIRLFVSLVCGFFLIGALLIRSAGIALLTGLVAWLVISFFSTRTTAIRRLKTFLPILAVGVAVQAAWMHWAANHEVLEWPMLEGYPKSYFAQLKVKSGNYPELGIATLADIPARVTRNLNEHAVIVAKLLTRKEFINDAWYSPLVLGPVLLIMIGVTSSMWPAGGGFPEWYFVSYETMYLLWPWFGEIRFFLPVAPLACLYLWRGGGALLRLRTEKRGGVGALLFPFCLSAAVFAGVAGWRSGHLQPEISAVFWSLLAVVTAWWMWTGSSQEPAVLPVSVLDWWPFAWLRQRSEIILQTLGTGAVIVLIVVGLAQELDEGRTNLSFDRTKMAASADVAAGKWIGANTSAAVIILAREPGLVYHFSGRKSVWFPASSDPQILMEGIRRHHVDFIVVSERRKNYWLPPESVCFESLRHTYPGAFQLVHREPLFSIFKLVPGTESAHL